MVPTHHPHHLTAGNWDVSPVVIAQSFLFQLVNMAIGFAPGLLILNSAIAIVLFILLPNLVFLLASVPAIKTAADWISPQQVLEPLLGTGVTGHQWSQILTMSLVWIAIPLLAGFTRLARHEITA